MTYTVTYNFNGVAGTTRVTNVDNVLTLALGNDDTSITVTVVAKDSKYSQSSAPVVFTINPFKCNSACSTCTTSSNGFCSACNSGWFLKGTTCETSCGSGYYGDTTARTCNTCPTGCATCSSPTSCQSCLTVDTTIYYLLDSSCGTTCPAPDRRANDGTHMCDGKNNIHLS